jgi:hypothetical protein
MVRIARCLIQFHWALAAQLPEQSSHLPSYLACIRSRGARTLAQNQLRGWMAYKSPRWLLAGLFKAKKPPPPAAPAATEFHAVSIIPGNSACAASYRFSGQRFLSRQAPRLPLPMCDARHCECRFKHHRDRRSSPRRSSDMGMMAGTYAGTERRRTAGRRRTDHL